MDQVIAFLAQYGQFAWGYLSRPVILIQLGIVGLLFLPALFLPWRVESQLEERARGIKGMPGLLRLIVVFLHRLEWLFFVLLLAIAYSVTAAFAWPEDSNYLIYSAMLLAGAWLVISVVSHVIRSRAVGRLFGFVAWVYVAATILGITAEVAALLDSAGFTVGAFRISVLRVLQAVVFLGALLWLSLAAGNFLDRRIQQIEELTPSLRVLIAKILRGEEYLGGTPEGAEWLDKQTKVHLARSQLIPFTKPS